MGNVSSMVTGGVTLSAATLAPAIAWALNGFPHPIPESVPYLIAAALLTGAHAAFNVITARMASSAKP